jgi:hypothetical protein
VCERTCILVRERDTGRQGEDLVTLVEKGDLPLFHSQFVVL